MKTKITVLVDNRLNPPLKSEHGLAILIEKDGKRILFDTAQTDILFFNAKELGISLKNLDYLVLSHGHYDHGGNIAKILELNPNISFVAHPNCTVPRYSIHAEKPIKSTALTLQNKQAIINLSHTKQRWCFKPTQIIDGVWVTGEIPRVTDFEDTGGPFFLDTEKKSPDLLPDDISLWIEDENEIIVICGCCHSGIVNTLLFIKDRTERGREKRTDKKITTLIGGLHLLHADKNRIEKTCNYLNSTDISTLFPMHCTGDKVINEMNSKINFRVVDNLADI